MAILKTILSTLGLEDGRVWVRWISAAEGAKFARTMNEVTQEIKRLGPNPLESDWSI
jgi:coenzyme F420-reducing hydrogenase delta subunit